MGILTIQSHVAYGYVGNRAAVFTLQRLGIDPWVINTVQFSNHTGYGAWQGEVLSPSHILNVYEGISQRGVLPQCQGMLTGYLGHPETAQAIVNIHKQLREQVPAIWCCDPVMGDYGRGVFVHVDIPEYMRNEVIPKADILTPNQFELELITGMEIQDMASAKQALNQVHAMGPGTVLLTSYVGKEHNSPGEICMLASHQGKVWRTATPYLELNPLPNGAGDTVAALFLANILKHKNVKVALENTTAAIYAVFKQTLQAGTRELQLVQSQDELARPRELFTASLA